VHGGGDGCTTCAGFACVCTLVWPCPSAQVRCDGDEMMPTVGSLVSHLARRVVGTMSEPCQGWSPGLHTLSTVLPQQQVQGQPGAISASDPSVSDVSLEAMTSAKGRNLLSLARLKHWRICTRPAQLLPLALWLPFIRVWPPGEHPGLLPWTVSEVVLHTQGTSAHIFSGLVAQGLKYSSNTSSAFTWPGISFNAFVW